MSVQLIIYPQFYDGLDPLSGQATEFIVDGINFDTVNTSSNSTGVGGALPQAFISANTFTPNTWYRFSSSTSAVTMVTNQLSGLTNTGVLQQLSNLTVGEPYDVNIDFHINFGTTFYQFSGGVLQQTTPITGTGATTITFTANSPDDLFVLFFTGVVVINTISVENQFQTTPLVGNPSNGQVILDLYEDEDIPLSLSVDDFKNAAEKVQSYSKAFKLPATKRNNQIFDNVFEVTRSSYGRGYVFNPYVKTRCELKQDGFILFEGYLQMIDVIDKEGEISYNVNMYSDVTALADMLGDRAFSDLDFTELKHLYNRTQIQNSWFKLTGVTYLNPSTSGFRDELSICYPFVNWTNQWTIADGSSSADVGMPKFTKLTDVFRPFIQVKYLIDRIFTQPNFPFSYTSDFFNTSEFANLYMDFNWGSDAQPEAENPIEGTGYYYRENGDGILPAGDIAIATLPSMSNYQLSKQIPGLGNPVPAANYDWATNKVTATVAGESYSVDYYLGIRHTGALADDIIKIRWKYTKAGGGIQYKNQQTYTDVSAGSEFYIQGSFNIILEDVNDTLECELGAGNGNFIQIPDIYPTSYPPGQIRMNVSNQAVTNNSLLQGLRGETGQWDFLKGIMTMFNLISIPDKSDPNNILIEPYQDVFIEDTNDPSSLTLAARGINHDWTEKIDQKEIKLEMLKDLDKKTEFKFVEDDDDAAFQGYKRAAGGYLYGSKVWDASTFGSLKTIFAGEEEIVAEPFATSVISPISPAYPDLMIPQVYAYNADDGTSEGFDNSPRIMYRADNNTGTTDTNGIQTMASTTYFVPGFGGVGSADLTSYLQFSHLSGVPCSSFASFDYNFGGDSPLLSPVGVPPIKNLFNLYWLPYMGELYHPDTRVLKVKVNLNAGDISTFNFYDKVFIKNRIYRVNSIEYKPNDLAVVEFILLP
tara:strand:- start:1800 stop:4583 length:2784 start_codon:yes stop_codon:yes gene_type:complete